MRFLVMRKESIATSVTASATLCTVHMYLISESLNKVNLSVLLVVGSYLAPRTATETPATVDGR